jgi:glycosyltransferase involved in cell wall biosynthesis
VILDIHDSLPETFAAKFPNAQFRWHALCAEERLSALVAHRVICVNHPQREAIVNRGVARSKTFVSLNVPDPKIFAGPVPTRPTAGHEGNFRLVYHGTMVRRLGVDLVIRSVAQLERNIPGIRLDLWGDGDDLESFRVLAQSLNLQNRVVFKPEGFRLEDLPEQLASMHVGVVGNRESIASELMLPVKLLEYVSLGIPAVVPRLRTIQYYFTDDMVSYYTPEDIESLAAAVCRLYRQPDLARRQAQRARAFLAEYGWERRGPELVSLYQTLVEC